MFYTSFIYNVVFTFHPVGSTFSKAGSSDKMWDDIHPSGSVFYSVNRKYLNPMTLSQMLCTNCLSIQAMYNIGKRSVFALGFMENKTRPLVAHVKFKTLGHYTFILSVSKKYRHDLFNLISAYCIKYLSNTEVILQWKFQKRTIFFISFFIVKNSWKGNKSVLPVIRYRKYAQIE